jgi:hypothetical protein
LIGAADASAIFRNALADLSAATAATEPELICRFG